MGNRVGKQMTTGYTDAKLAMLLRHMAVDCELSGEIERGQMLAAAAHRLEVIAQHTRQDDEGIWSYYRQEMWSHGDA